MNVQKFSDSSINLELKKDITIKGKYISHKFSKGDVISVYVDVFYYIDEWYLSETVSSKMVTKDEFDNCGYPFFKDATNKDVFNKRLEIVFKICNQNLEYNINFNQDTIYDKNLINVFANLVDDLKSINDGKGTQFDLREYMTSQDDLSLTERHIYK